MYLYFSCSCVFFFENLQTVIDASVLVTAMGIAGVVGLSGPLREDAILVGPPAGEGVVGAEKGIQRKHL